MPRVPVIYIHQEVVMPIKFTARAQKALDAAQEIAGGQGAVSVSALHILRGLLRDTTGVGLNVMQNCRVVLRDFRAQADEALARGVPSVAAVVMTAEGLPYTADAQAMLAAGEAKMRELGHHYFGTEHLLLGLAAVPDGPVADLFRSWQLTSEKVLHETRLLLG